MKNLLKITQLFDLYGELLPNKQHSYIVDYYFNDLSLSEIATKNKISRSAIHYSIKEGIRDMQNYENTLNFLQKQRKRLELYSQIKDEKIREELLKLEGLKSEKY